jgi:hypothetical protein
MFHSISVQCILHEYLRAADSTSDQNTLIIWQPSLVAVPTSKSQPDLLPFLLHPNLRLNLLFLS